MATSYTTRKVDALRKRADGFNDMADFLERKSNQSTLTDEFVELLTPYLSNEYVHTVHLTVTKYNDDTQKYDDIDEEATEANVKMFTRACGGIVEKVYDDDNVDYVKEFENFKLIGRVDRKLVCKPLKVEKTFHPAYTSKGYWSETVTEWDCAPDDK